MYDLVGGPTTHAFERLEDPHMVEDGTLVLELRAKPQHGPRVPHRCAAGLQNLAVIAFIIALIFVLNIVGVRVTVVVSFFHGAKDLAREMLQVACDRFFFGSG